MAEQVFVATPFSGAGGRIIASPFQFLTDADTYLRVVSKNWAAGVVLAVEGRRLDEKGAIQTLNETHTPNTDRSSKTTDYKLGAGALLNLTVFATAGSPIIGSTFVIVQLLRNTGATAIVLGTLLAGYVTTSQAIGFPGSPILSSVEGEGAIRSLLGTQPGAGLGILETCPAGARWELMSIQVPLTTSAAVGGRVVFVQLTGSTGKRSQTTAGGTQGPGITASYTFGQGISPFADTDNPSFQGPIPQRQYLLAGDTIGIADTLGAAGDQFGAPIYQVREHLEAP